MAEAILSKRVIRNVSLEQTDFSIVQSFALKTGLGGKGFSAALRMIIREWSEHKAEQRVKITAAGQAALQDAKENEPEP